MKTILVGDLHLTAQIILPMVEENVKAMRCRRVILLGDYMDAYNQTKNIDLYMREVDYLLMWKSKMQTIGIEVITLLGNHDAPYLTFNPKYYSLMDSSGIIAVHNKLMKLGVQVAFQLEDYLVSHAGYTEDYVLEEWHLKKISASIIENIAWLNTHIGWKRGGQYISGSPLWADFEELTRYPNLNYPKQIVGHTPQNKVKIECNLETKIIGIDTFTIIPLEQSPYYQQLGTGEILLYEHGKIRTLSLNWKNEDIIKKIDSKFDR